MNAHTFDEKPFPDPTDDDNFTDDDIGYDCSPRLSPLDIGDMYDDLDLDDLDDDCYDDDDEN